MYEQDWWYAMTAQALLLEAVPSLEKNRDLLMEMLMRPDDFTLAALGCNVRVFLERNGVDITLDPLRMKQGVMAQELSASLQ